jgi:GNAT superfamily N-acetyltransferase
VGNPVCSLTDFGILVGGHVVPGIDAAWLERLFAEDPAAHALALWDRRNWPEVVEFRTLVERDRPTAYLLIWNGLPGCPVIHWLGIPEDPAPLLAELPRPPFLAIVPTELGGAVTRRVGASKLYPIHLRRRPKGPSAFRSSLPARRLGPEDSPALRALAEGDGSSVTDTYLAIDLARDWVVGGFSAGRLVAAARAEVRLPEVWHVSGVYTDPAGRGRGWGRTVVSSLLGDAWQAGASAALFVRDDNLPARRLYDGLGFDSGTPRLWVDAGADRSP